MNAIEKCYLYNAVKTGIDLNEFYTDTQNTMLDALMQQCQYRHHCHHTVTQPTTQIVYLGTLNSSCLIIVSTCLG
jgi:hypothetical protein